MTLRPLIPYLASLGAGGAVGGVYAMLHVPSPAPPPIALVGLLGMVIGELVGRNAVGRMRRRKVRDPQDR